MSEYDGVCVVTHKVIKSKHSLVFFKNQDGKYFFIPLSEEEANELIACKSDNVASLDPLQRGSVSDKQTVAPLLNEIEGLDMNHLDGTFNRFCQIIIQKDIHGETCAMLISEDRKIRKISVITALIISIKRPEIELTACTTLFKQEKLEESLLDLEPL